MTSGLFLCASRLIQKGPKLGATRVTYLLASGSQHQRVAPHVCGGTFLNAVSLHLSASLPDILIHEIHLFRHPHHFAYVDREPDKDFRGGVLPVRHEQGLDIALIDEVLAPHRRAVCGRT